MFTHQLTEISETVGLRRCCACTAELLDRDKFCRRCGVKQITSYATSTDLAHMAEGETKPLSGGPAAYTSYSGQLIKIVAESMSVRTSVQGAGRGPNRLICTLITIPIWMLIVMLSPLDAYAAAKAAAGCVNGR